MAQWAQPPTQAQLWGQQPAPMQQAALGYVRLHIQGSIWTTGMLLPTVTVNGYRAAVKYGVNILPVYPGRTVVEASMQWMRTYGQGACTVDLGPGQVADVWYVAPNTQIHVGSMGLTPQRRKGGWALAGLTAVLLFVVFGIPIAVILAASR